MASRFSKLHETNNPVEGELVRDLLEQQGIEARLIGTTNAAILGASPHIFKLRIEVPLEQLEEAFAVLEAFHAGEATALDALEDAFDDHDSPQTTGGPYRGHSAEDDAQPRRHLMRVLAAGAACIIPGGSHFYIGRWVTGLILLVASFVGIFLAFTALAEGALLSISVLVCDLIIGQLAIGAAREGHAPTNERQVLVGVGVLAAALCLAGLSYVWLDSLPSPHPHLEYYDDLGEEGEQPLEVFPPDMDFPLNIQLEEGALDGGLKSRSPAP